MKKGLSKVAAIAAAGLFGVSSIVSAHHLTPPTDVLCPIVGDVIAVDWADVTDATKYSVNVVATYDTGMPEDPTDDTTVDFDFGTGDRTDGAPINQSDLQIPLSDLVLESISPYSIQLRVKGLHPGKGQSRQNNPFSAFCIPA